MRPLRHYPTGALSCDRCARRCGVGSALHIVRGTLSVPRNTYLMCCGICDWRRSCHLRLRFVLAGTVALLHAMTNEWPACRSSTDRIGSMTWTTLRFPPHSGTNSVGPEGGLANFFPPA